MAFSPGALLNVLRRDKAKDPFGGDDLFDGESSLAGKGPKIALVASGVLFLILAAGVTTIILTGDKNAATPAAGGMLTDLKVEEDVPAEAAPAVAANAASAPANAPVVAHDATAATDRSVQRRPWLTAAEPADAKRLGMNDTSKARPAAPPALAPPPAAPPPAPMPPAKVAAAPPVAAPAAPAAAAVTPPAKEPPKAASVDTKVAAVPPAPATPAKPPLPETKAAEVHAIDIKPVEEEAPQPPKEIAGIPALNASGAAPGAPKLFDLPKNAETGPNAAGGRPRLAEPAIPPTDKVALNAPPPRFAALSDVKKEAKTAPAPITGAKLAVVVDGLGLSQAATDAAITKLPAAVTLAFSPYARDLKKWIEKAKAGGHEVLIEVPMESKSFPAEDPGPLGLLTSNDAKENQIRLDAILKEAGSAIGVLDSNGSKFREDQNINTLFAKLKEKNLFYIQGEPGVRVGEPGVPTAVADVVVDERPFRAAVDARLDYAERLAKYQGSAVASMSAKPVNFERLVLWLEQSQKKGVSLAPVSQVLIR